MRIFLRIGDADVGQLYVEILINRVQSAANTVWSELVEITVKRKEREHSLGLCLPEIIFQFDHNILSYQRLEERVEKLDEKSDASVNVINMLRIKYIH